jgi:hypothetical protein
VTSTLRESLAAAGISRLAEGGYPWGYDEEDVHAVAVA